MIFKVVNFSGTYVIYHQSAAFGRFMCHLYNWHIGIHLCLQLTHNGVNEAQHGLHYLTSLLWSVVCFKRTHSKLYNSNNDCGDGSNIENQSLVEFGGKEFHNINGGEENVENSSTTNVEYHKISKTSTVIVPPLQLAHHYIQTSKNPHILDIFSRVRVDYILFGYLLLFAIFSISGNL